MSFRNRLVALCMFIAWGMSACGGSGGGTSSGLPQGQPSSFGATAQTATHSYSLGSVGGTYDLPPLGGFSGSLALSATSVPVNTLLQLTSSLRAPAGAPILAQDAQRRTQNAGTLDVYFYTTIQVSSTITFATLPTFSVTLPATVKPAGLQFFYAISNPTPTNNAKLQFRTEGPATVAGQIVTFAPSSTPLTLRAGKSYTIAFYAISAIGPTPSPLNGNIYVAGGTTVKTYTASGKRTTPTINLPASPGGLAVDAAGKIYVTLPAYNIVTTYNSDGSQTTPTITTGLNLPQGVAVDAAGKIYVTNGGGFPPRSYALTTYAPNGLQTTPTIAGVGPGGVAVDAAGKIHVANYDLLTYTASGKPTAPTIPLFVACGVAVDAAGKIYVTIQFPDPSNTGILATYAPDGTLTSPTIEGLNAPCGPFDKGGVAVDPAGKIYVITRGDDTLRTYTANRTPTTPTITGLQGAIGVAVH